MKILITRRPVLKYKVGMAYDVDSNLAANLIRRGLAEVWNPVTETKEEKPVIVVKEAEPVIVTPIEKPTKPTKPANQTSKPKTKPKK